MVKIRLTLALMAIPALASLALAHSQVTTHQQPLTDSQRQAQVVAQQNAIQECVTLHSEGKKEEAEKKLAAIVAKNPSMGYTADVMRLGWLAVDDRKAWEKEVVAISKSSDELKQNTLGSFTWDEVCSKSGSKALAKKTIELALKASNHKSIIVLFWAVMVYDKTNDYRRGLDSVNTLFKLLPKSPQKNNASLVKQMEEKRTELEAKLKAKT